MMSASAALLLCNQQLLIAVFCLYGCWRGRTGITTAIKCLTLQAACLGTAGAITGMIDIAGKMTL